jgi:putative ABC transport system substrate-binding protein
LVEHGWVEGRNIVYEIRFANGQAERLPDLARELVALQPDVIFAFALVAAKAALQATQTIPIVANTSDPVGVGFAESLARPGRNVTGVAPLTIELGPKLLELLREALPHLERLAVLTNPAETSGYPMEKEFFAATQAMSLKVVHLKAQSVPEIEQAFVRLGRERVDALVIAPSAFLFANRREIAELIRKHRVPTGLFGYATPDWGALLTYQQPATEAFRLLAKYIDRMLRGERPAETPFERATRFELAIDLKVAKELGITMPRSLILRADQVIE